MRSVPNTVRKGGIYHFRRAIPLGLQGIFKRADLTFSLRTAEKGIARRQSRTLYVCTEHLFDAVRNAPMLSDLDIAAMVKAFYPQPVRFAM